MIDGLPLDPDSVTSIGVLVTVATLVITDRLVWHTRLKAAEERADRWEHVALDAMRTGTQVGVRAAEVSSNVISRLPQDGE